MIRFISKEEVNQDGVALPWYSASLAKMVNRYWSNMEVTVHRCRAVLFSDENNHTLVNRKADTGVNGEDISKYP